MSSQRSPTERTRNYTTIVYPESADADWITQLRKLQVPAVISPLHDKDLHNDGQMKKPHFHVVLMFESLKSINQANDICKAFGGVGCEKVNSTRHMLRYLCHLDELDKPRYDVEQVTVIGDIDYRSIIESSVDDIAFMKDITFYIHNNHITNFADFMVDCATNNPEWFRLIAGGKTLYVSSLIKAERWSCL